MAKIKLRMRRIPFLLAPLLLFSLMSLFWFLNNQETKEEIQQKDLNDTIWPVDRAYGHDHISSPFGYRYDPFTGAWVFHSGIDLAIDLGEAVYAIREGEVILASDQYPGFGALVVIEHKNIREEGERIRSLYGHCDQILVQENQRVLLGERIATIGSRGRSTGPHLHFEIQRYLEEEDRWVVVDPLEYVDLPNN